MDFCDAKWAVAKANRRVPELPSLVGTTSTLLTKSESFVAGGVLLAALARAPGASSCGCAPGCGGARRDAE